MRCLYGKKNSSVVHFVGFLVRGLRFLDLGVARKLREASISRLGIIIIQDLIAGCWDARRPHDSSRSMLDQWFRDDGSVRLVSNVAVCLSL